MNISRFAQDPKTVVQRVVVHLYLRCVCTCVRVSVVGVDPPTAAGGGGNSVDFRLL